MDWIQLAIAIVGVVTLEGIIQFFFIRVRKQKQVVENVDSQVSVAQHANDLLSTQLERSHETISNLNTENSALHKVIGELKATQACLFDDMCVHKGCRLRKPHQGQGQLWYENYRNDPTLGADYDSIDTLLKKERTARLKAEKETETAS